MEMDLRAWKFPEMECGGGKQGMEISISGNFLRISAAALKTTS